MIRPIVSAQNDNIKLWKQLSASKGIRKNGCFFLMGEKLVKEFLKKPGFEILAEVMGPEHQALLKGRDYDRVPKYQLTQELFDEVDVVGTHFNLLLLKAPEIELVDLAKPSGLELVLPIGDPGNLGACLRSAYAFGVKRVFLTKEASHPFHPKAIKASAGASLKLEIFSTLTLAETLEQSPASQTLVLEQGGNDIARFKWPRNAYLFVGEEGPGLPENHLTKVSIRTHDTESLNAAVAVSLACFAHQQVRPTFL